MANGAEQGDLLRILAGLRSGSHGYLTVTGPCLIFNVRLGMNITFANKLSRDEIFESNSAMHGNPSIMWACLMLLFVCSVAYFYISIFSKIAAIVVCTVIIVFFLTLILIVKLKERKAKIASETEDAGEIELTENGIRISGTGQTAFLEWAAFTKHYLGEKVFMLFTARGNCVILPLRVFPDAATRKSYIEQVISHVPEAHIPKHQA